MSQEAPDSAIAVCLARCPASETAAQILPDLLDRAELWGGRSLHGLRILVKPNLLRNSALACTDPHVVAAVCQWLLEAGASVVVADSPGFGTARSVARDTGLSAALARLGLAVQPMARGEPMRLSTGSVILISRTALDADLILSVPKVKAHSQMRLSLSCKNLYGCVPGLYKAFYHTREGDDPGHFAAMQAALLHALPPVAAVADGIVAMHRTGPSGGDAFPLGLVAASSSPVALDEVLCHVLGQEPVNIPLQKALMDAGHRDCESQGRLRRYPLLRPEEVARTDFLVPVHLMHTSFKPMRLLRSCCIRLWKEYVVR